MALPARKIHVIATAVVGVQLLVWTVTGLAFTLFDFGAVHGTKDRAPPLAVDLAAVRVGAEEAARVAVSRRGGAGTSVSPAEAVRSVTLETLSGRPTYVVLFVDDKNGVLVDATNGVVSSGVDRDTASSIARGAHVGRPSARVVERRHEDDRDVFVVHLDDPARTDVTVDGVTGDVTAWRNRDYRVFDALWSAHVLAYVDGRSPANWPLRIVALVAVVASVSGTASLLTRLREWARARRSTSAPSVARAPSAPTPT